MLDIEEQDFLYKTEGGGQDTKPPVPNDAAELYIQMLAYIEKMHRRLLDLIKDNLDRFHKEDINSVQALLVYNIGKTEMTAGEIRSRGYYLGSNVSYNLKKLVESGYVDHRRSQSDKRSVRVKLTKKGLAIYDLVQDLYHAQYKRLSQQKLICNEEFIVVNEIFQRLQTFWFGKQRLG